MADVVAHPTFPDDELKRLREERLPPPLPGEGDPEKLIQVAFSRIVFGAAHPFGTPAVGTAASAKGITAPDLKAFHDSQYRPSNAALIVAGDVTADAVMPMLERAFGTWQGVKTSGRTLGIAPQLTARRVHLIDKPDAAQSQIRIGWVGAARS